MQLRYDFTEPWSFLSCYMDQKPGPSLSRNSTSSRSSKCNASDKSSASPGTTNSGTNASEKSAATSLQLKRPSRSHFCSGLDTTAVLTSLAPLTWKFQCATLKKTWLKQIGNDLRNQRITLTDAKALATDRSAWRHVVN